MGERGDRGSRLPPAATPNANLGGFAPPNSRAIETEAASAKAFGFPILSRTVLVQHDEHGLTQAAQHRVLERAVAVAKRTLPDAGPIAGVVPITNTAGAFPSSSEQGTTALSYVLTKPGTTFREEVAAAATFGEKHINQPDDHLVGVTGTIPAQLEQSGSFTTTCSCSRPPRWWWSSRSWPSSSDRWSLHS